MADTPTTVRGRTDKGTVITVSEDVARAMRLKSVDSDDPAVDPGPSRPTKNDKVEVWREYAAALGVADVDELTKEELYDQVDQAEA